MCPREYDTSNAQETGSMPSVNAAEAEASTSTAASSQKTDQRDISAFSDERWVQVSSQRNLARTDSHSSDLTDTVLCNALQPGAGSAGNGGAEWQCRCGTVWGHDLE